MCQQVQLLDNAYLPVYAMFQQLDARLCSFGSCSETHLSPFEDRAILIEYTIFLNWLQGCVHDHD